MAKVTTPEFRAAFIQVFKPGKPKDAKPEQLPNYSIRAAFPPTTDLSTLKAEAQRAAEAKWGEGKIPKTLRSPFRRNDELDTPIKGIDDDWIVMTFTRREADGRPGVVDQNVQAILDESDVYAGAWFFASVNAYGYEHTGNKGVAFGLQNVQLSKDDEALGRGRSKPEDDFAPVGGGAAKNGGASANTLFD